MAGSVNDLPADWFTRASERGGEKALIAETGWNSSGLSLGTRSGCLNLLDTTEANAAAYLSRVLAAGAATNMDLVTWWSNRDVIDESLMTNCPCSFDARWCAVLEAFRGPVSDGGPDTQARSRHSVRWVSAATTELRRPH
jgi:hypothetical protein